jgi:hypothetical protein
MWPASLAVLLSPQAPVKSLHIHRPAMPLKTHVPISPAASIARKLPKPILVAAAPR